MSRNGFQSVAVLEYLFGSNVENHISPDKGIAKARIPLSEAS